MIKIHFENRLNLRAFQFRIFLLKSCGRIRKPLCRFAIPLFQSNLILLSGHARAIYIQVLSNIEQVQNN